MSEKHSAIPPENDPILTDSKVLQEAIANLEKDYANDNSFEGPDSPPPTIETPMLKEVSQEKQEVEIVIDSHLDDRGADAPIVLETSTAMVPSKEQLPAANARSGVVTKVSTLMTAAEQRVDDFFAGIGSYLTTKIVEPISSKLDERHFEKLRRSANTPEAIMSLARYDADRFSQHEHWTGKENRDFIELPFTEPQPYFFPDKRDESAKIPYGQACYIDGHELYTATLQHLMIQNHQPVKIFQAAKRRGDDTEGSDGILLTKPGCKEYTLDEHATIRKSPRSSTGHNWSNCGTYMPPMENVVLESSKEALYKKYQEWCDEKRNYYRTMMEEITSAISSLPTEVAKKQRKTEEDLRKVVGTSAWGEITDRRLLEALAETNKEHKAVTILFHRLAFAALLRDSPLIPKCVLDEHYEIKFTPESRGRKRDTSFDATIQRIHEIELDIVRKIPDILHEQKYAVGHLSIFNIHETPFHGSPPTLYEYRELKQLPTGEYVVSTCIDIDRDTPAYKECKEWMKTHLSSFDIRIANSVHRSESYSVLRENIIANKRHFTEAELFAIAKLEKEKHGTVIHV